jgi:hypothetical protein
MGLVRCALVVPYDADVDEELLEAVAAATGKRFSRYGSGGFGVEVLATLYSSEAGEQIIEATAVEVPTKAVLIRAEGVEAAVAIRQVVGDRLGGWDEHMIRARIDARPGGDPRMLVGLAMAAGGAPISPESRDLLSRAAASRDRNVRGLAEYALRVAADLQDVPMVRKEEERGLPEALRPAGPVDGDEDWVTARPGVPARQIPRPVAWLRGTADIIAVMIECGDDLDWFHEVCPRTDETFQEDIWITADGRTAVHAIEHPALDAPYAAVHGVDTAAVLAALTGSGDLVPIDGPPASLHLTAP